MYDRGEGINFNFETADSKTLLDCDLVIKNTGKRPELSDFNNREPSEIAADTERVKRLSSRFVYDPKKHNTESETAKSKKSKEISDAVEALLGTQIYFQNWLGEPCVFDRTTLFDDYVKGADFAGKYEINGKNVYLSIDNTTSCNDADITNKFNRNIEKLLNGGAEIKYFESEDGSQMSITDAIPLVIGIDPNNAKDLISRYAQIIRLSQKSEKSESDKRTLTSLNREFPLIPAQKVFIEEIEKQLVMYQEILKSKNDEKYSGTLDQINSMMQKVGEIKRDKEGISIGEWARDGVLSQISYACDRFTPRANKAPISKAGQPS